MSPTKLRTGSGRDSSEIGEASMACCGGCEGGILVSGGGGGRLLAEGGVISPLSLGKGNIRVDVALGSCGQDLVSEVYINFGPQRR